MKSSGFYGMEVSIGRPDNGYSLSYLWFAIFEVQRLLAARSA
jgi:hypothetical protein